MIGGQGEKKTLRLMAQYADDGQPHLAASTSCPASSRCSQRHCADVGRDPADINKTSLCTVVVAPTTEEAERLRNDFLRPRHGLGLPRRCDACDGAARLVVGDADTAGERIQRAARPRPRWRHLQHARQWPRSRRRGAHRSASSRPPSDERQRRASSRRPARGRGRDPEAVEHRPRCRSRTRRWWRCRRAPADDRLRYRRVRRHRGQPIADLQLLLVELVAELGAPLRPPDSWRMKPRTNVVKASVATGMSSSAKPACWNMWTASWTSAVRAAGGAGGWRRSVPGSDARAARCGGTGRCRGSPRWAPPGTRRGARRAAPPRARPRRRAGPPCLEVAIDGHRGPSRVAPSRRIVSPPGQPCRSPRSPPRR